MGSCATGRRSIIRFYHFARTNLIHHLECFALTSPASRYYVCIETHARSQKEECATTKHASARIRARICARIRARTYSSVSSILVTVRRRTQREPGSSPLREQHKGDKMFFLFFGNAIVFDWQCVVQHRLRDKAARRTVGSITSRLIR